MKPAKKIVFLGTGGTIAGTAASAGDNIGYTAAQVGIQDLLATVPGLEGLDVVSEQVAQVDSKDMEFGIWAALLARVAHWLADDGVVGVVITHGTDTLEETAFFLQSVLQPRKPVVLTCAMRPATALAPDGPQNLLDAVAVVLAPHALGVVGVCAGKIHSARDVQKVHPYRLDAFDSGDAGPVGYVEEGAVVLMRNWPQPQEERMQNAIYLIASGAPWPRVEIVMSHAGAGAALVDALMVQPPAPTPPVRGLVVATTGNGTVHQALEVALLRAQTRGVRVVRATRCTQGRILPTAASTLPSAAGLTPVKARVAMVLALMAPEAQATGNSVNFVMA